MELVVDGITVSNHAGEIGLMVLWLVKMYRRKIFDNMVPPY